MIIKYVVPKGVYVIGIEQANFGDGVGFYGFIDKPIITDCTVAIWREKPIPKQLLTIPGANTILGYSIVSHADDPATILMVKDQYRDNPEGVKRIVGEKLMNRILTLYP